MKGERGQKEDKRGRRLKKIKEDRRELKRTESQKRSCISVDMNAINGTMNVLDKRK